MLNFKLAVFSVVFMLIAVAVSAQSRTQQGAILRRGGATRVSGAIIENKKNNTSVLSNQLGFFSIMASPGDTLQVSATGYTSLSVVVTDFKDQILYLFPITALDAVVIQGKTLEAELSETQADFRKKGVYYNGRPPLLASLASPLTALNELFGKSAKRARRFQEYAGNELEYQEISKRFSISAIKSAVPEISDDDLPIFRSEYLPSLEQIRRWSDYDIIVYIKSSYKTFLDIKATEAQEAEAKEKAARDSVSKAQKPQ